MDRKLHRLRMAAPAGIAVGLGMLMLAGTATARAEPAPDVIQYGDLNMSTAAGIQTLSDRVRTAAWDYCLKRVPPASPPEDIDNLHCQQSVIDEALAKIHNPMLTRMFPAQLDDEYLWRRG